MPKALITGGTGFIGSHLAEKLIEKGWTVFCLVRDPDRLRWLEPVRDRIHFIEGDINTVPDLPEVEYIFHLAGMVRAVKDKDYYSVNTGGVKNLYRKACRVDSAKRFIFLSSLAAAGPSSRPEGRDEEEGNAPVSEYGKSKLAAEEFLKNEKSLPWVILRPGAVYGPRDRDVFKVFRMAARGWFFMPGREERMASFIYVADLVNAIILAAEHPSAVFRTYLLAYPETVSWKSFAERIAGLAGKRLKTVPVPLPAVSLLCRINSFLSLCTGRPLLLNSDKEKEMRPLCWTARPEKFIIETGFKYEFSARRAVPATWDWYRRAGWLKD